MTTTDPTPLAAQIAQEHWLNLDDECGTCGPGDYALCGPRNYALHIATVTEQAVRERVAEEIERLRDALTGDPDRAALELLIEDAARIARGDTR